MSTSEKINEHTGNSSNEHNLNNCNRISVKVPNFWPNNAKLFFLQLESSFRISGVTAEQTKFDTLVASLDAETLSHATDLISNPSKETPYTNLKNRLLNEFECSKTRKIKTLLEDLELGDKSPSLLLRQMRDLSEKHIDEEFLKNIWMRRLPNQVQAILSVSSENLNKLAEMADKIFECNSGFVASISLNDVQSKTSSSENALEKLQTQVNKLSKQINELSFNQPKRFRKRSSSISSNSSFKGKKSNWLCWYHFRFKENARKCVKPCAYDAKNELNQQK